MVRVRVIPKEEAQQTRKAKTPGIRRQRMNEFDAYVQPLIENPGEAAVYEEIGEEAQKFVLSLRGAFRRAGMPVAVRKMRGRDEVRAWLEERPAAAPAPEAGKKVARGRQSKK